MASFVSNRTQFGGGINWVHGKWIPQHTTQLGGGINWFDGKWIPQHSNNENDRNEADLANELKIRICRVGECDLNTVVMSIAGSFSIPKDADARAIMSRIRSLIIRRTGDIIQNATTIEQKTLVAETIDELENIRKLGVPSCVLYLYVILIMMDLDVRHDRVERFERNIMTHHAMVMAWVTLYCRLRFVYGTFPFSLPDTSPLAQQLHVLVGKSHRPFIETVSTVRSELLNERSSAVSERHAAFMTRCTRYAIHEAIIVEAYKNNKNISELRELYGILQENSHKYIYRHNTTNPYCDNKILGRISGTKSNETCNLIKQHTVGRISTNYPLINLILTYKLIHNKSSNGFDIYPYLNMMETQNNTKYPDILVENAYGNGPIIRIITVHNNASATKSKIHIQKDEGDCYVDLKWVYDSIDNQNMIEAHNILAKQQRWGHEVKEIIKKNQKHNLDGLAKLLPPRISKLQEITEEWTNINGTLGKYNFLSWYTTYLKQKVEVPASTFTTCVVPVLERIVNSSKLLLNGTKTEVSNEDVILVYTSAFKKLTAWLEICNKFRQSNISHEGIECANYHRASLLLGCREKYYWSQCAWVESVRGILKHTNINTGVLKNWNELFSSYMGTKANFKIWHDAWRSLQVIKGNSDSECNSNKMSCANNGARTHYGK